jgi:hypothetical protein
MDLARLERQVKTCRGILDDIGDLMEEVIEGNPTPDQVSNVLLGMQELYSIRFNKLSRELGQILTEGEGL